MIVNVVNQSTVPLGCDYNTLLTSLKSYIDDYVGPDWGVACSLLPSKKISTKTANLVFLDDADAANALGYHDVSLNGYPILKIFVKTTLADKELVSVTASHELAEALVDPSCQLWAQRTTKELWAYEVCDAVEETSFDIGGLQMSNYVLPSFFESFRTKKPFDALGKLRAPFTLLPGGYTIIQAGGKVTQRFGSINKKRSFKKQDHRGHRSEHYRLQATAHRGKIVSDGLIY